MSMAFNTLGMILFVSSAFAVELSVCIGVSGWGWPSLTSVCRIETAVFVLMNSALNSASATDDMTAFIIWEILRTAQLLRGMFSLPAMNMWPLARLHALGSDKYEALLWMARTMLLAWNVSIASSILDM